MYDDVLVPTDGSDTVSETLEHATAIAGNDDATIHALYVVDQRITRAADREMRSDLEDSLEAEGRKAVEAVREHAEDAGLETIDEIRHGTPSREILEYASGAGIDLIVIGTQGKTPREKVSTLGSVSERVVDGASIPVLVVRNPSPDVE